MRYTPIVRWSGWLIGLAVVVLTAGVAYVLATGRDVSVPARVMGWVGEKVAPPDPAKWPGPLAPLRSPDVVFPENFGPFKVFLDPGHGAEGNTGNFSSYCEDEQDFTLAIAQELANYLTETKRFEVELSRRGDMLVPYPKRVERAAAWGAHVFISLHSDVRGTMTLWSPDAGLQCPRSENAAGFSVLWSDEGPLTDSRRSLARVMAKHLAEAGFPAYDGSEYETYDGDDVSGVFVDRHAPGKRIFVLRKPKMPSVIVETHNAWDAGEALRWESEETRRVFFATMAASLVEFLGSS